MFSVAQCEIAKTVIGNSQLDKLGKQRHYAGKSVTFQKQRDLLMSTITVYIRRPRKTAKQIIRSLPGYCSGRLRDTYSIGKAFRLNFLVRFLEKVHEGYLAKSAGGNDDLGNKWKPLSPATIAARPLQPGDRKKFGITSGMKHRGLLTAEQDREWRGIFKSTFLKLLSRIGEAAAKAQAAKLAWAIVKSHGAKTKLDTLGRRKVPILIDTGRLLESWSPGRARAAKRGGGAITSYQPPKEQIFTSRRGEMIVGSRVPYAGKVEKVRPVVPKNKRPWVDAAAQAGVDAAVSMFHVVIGA